VTVAGSSLERIGRLTLKILDEVGQVALLVAAMGRHILSRPWAFRLHFK